MATLVVFQVPASAAASDPYTPGSTGFDISYPNCSAASLPSGATFAVVGVGGGRPFTSNSCAASEWSQAQAATESTPSLYFNTGYAGAYGRDIDATCKSALSSVPSGLFGSLRKHALSQAEQAWEIGCSEAEYANTVTPGSPAMWWADIETGNSWSTNSSLNRFTIDGISYEMAALGEGGIYSSPTMWAAITGSIAWAPTPPVAANWLTGGACATTFGASVPTWLLQGPATNGIDSDTAC